MMAGEGREPLVEPARQGLGAVLGRKVGGEVAHEGGKIALRDRRGRFAHHQSAGAETLDDEAERGQFGSIRLDQRRRVGIEIDDERREQRLPLNCALRRAPA